MSRHHVLIKNDPRYKAARLEAFERDGWACVDCGATEDLQADHTIELAELVATDQLDLAWDVDNLVTRCGPHNRERFLRPDKATVRLPYVSERYPALEDLLGERYAVA